MINALDLNCQILALDTVFNREMLENKKSVFFNKKSINKKINELEEKYDELIQKNCNYKISKKYDWENITYKYLKIFQKLKAKIN